MLNNNDKIRITEGHLSKYASHAKPQRVVLDYAMYLCSFDANLILWIKLILSKCVNLNLWRNLLLSNHYENFLPYFKILQQSACHI